MSRMTTGKGDSRKPARHKANGAVDFLCLLSINGDVKCKSRIVQKEHEAGKQDKDKNTFKEQQILREDEENQMQQILREDEDKQKQARREEEDFLEKAVGMEVEKETDESVIVNVSPEFTEPGMT